MLNSNPIAGPVLLRIDEEAALTLKLMERVPADAENWRPDWPSPESPPFTVQLLCWHLCEAFAGICAVAVKLRGAADPQAEALRARVAEGRLGGVAASRALLSDLTAFAHARLSATSDADLARLAPTAFVPSGKPVMATLLINLAHFTNHKYQLFTYLKILNVPVGTKDLYRFDT